VHRWTASIKPRLLFSHAGYASWGLFFSSVLITYCALSWDGSVPVLSKRNWQNRNVHKFHALQIKMFNRNFKSKDRTVIGTPGGHTRYWRWCFSPHLTHMDSDDKRTPPSVCERWHLSSGSQTSLVLLLLHTFIFAYKIRYTLVLTTCIDVVRNNRTHCIMKSLYFRSIKQQSIQHVGHQHKKVLSYVYPFNHNLIYMLLC